MLVGKKEDVEYFSDLKEDESETTNLTDASPDKRREHRALLKNWITEVKGIIPEGQKALS